MMHRLLLSNSSLLLSLLLTFGWTFHTTTTNAQCIDDFNTIYDLEASVLDPYTVNRTYTICPQKLYEIAYLDFQYNLRPNNDGYPPLPLRPNIHYKCGDTAVRSNLCFITGGHWQLDGTGIRGITEPSIYNIIVEGFTFIDANKHSFWSTKPGSVTFKDCEWRDFTRSTGAPIMLDYYDITNNLQTLEVKFENCLFRDNRYFGYGTETSLIMANSNQNSIQIADTVFVNNDMMINNTSPVMDTYMIESLGRVSIRGSCFVSNQVNAAGIAVYGNQLNTSEIYVSNSGGRLCSFASVFETLQQYSIMNPTCIDATKVQCDLPVDAGQSVPEIPTTELVSRYVPFAIGALEYDYAKDSDSFFQGGCNREGEMSNVGPDASNTNDPICSRYTGCTVSYTDAGEQLLYRFGHFDIYEVDGSVLVDITLRLSSARPKQVKLDLYYQGDTEIAATTILSTGIGDFEDFIDYTWSNVKLKASETVHTLLVTFVDGSTNFCTISASYSNEPANSGTNDGFPDISPTNASHPTPATAMQTPTSPPTLFQPVTLPPMAATAVNSPTRLPIIAQPQPTTTSPASTLGKGDFEIIVPGDYSAMYFTDESVAAGQKNGDCPASKPGSFVDAWITDDVPCGLAMNVGGIACYIETGPGEFVTYDFWKDSTQEEVTITIRISSPDLEQIELEIYSYSDSRVVQTFSGTSPGKGTAEVIYTTYVVWHKINLGTGTQYRLKVSFPTGGVKLCSIGIQ